MSVQFGTWNFDGRLTEREDLRRISTLLSPYGPDGSGEYAKGGVSILYRAFHTTKESRLETQPYLLRSGAVLTWNGRLDNRSELLSELSFELRSDAPDAAIVAAAYDRWETRILPKLVGDWALSVYDPLERALLLAKDFLGSRPLYYSSDETQITWSSLLDPFVFLSRRTIQLDEEYLAGWITALPAAHLTPYAGIHSVPPSSFARISEGNCTIQKYWNFARSKEIRCATDRDYQAQFRALFAQSVRRRLRSDSPVLAELSGGMDSSSIVCMADTILARGDAQTSRIDTVSYYDDREPNWNERPYFATVERRRGRTGCHIDVSQGTDFPAPCDPSRFSPIPGNGRSESASARKFRNCLIDHGNRVLLSGIGGDEFLGGVPASLPELADHFACGRWRVLAKQMISWALVDRRPLLFLAGELLRSFLPMRVIDSFVAKRPPAWLERSFVRRHRELFRRHRNQFRLFGPHPSFQDNCDTLDHLSRRFGCSDVPCEPCYERRFPCLDRDLLEFVFAIPREQLARPGRRRFLMRNALEGIVPTEILARRRKAFLSRTPMIALAREAARPNRSLSCALGASLGIVNGQSFSQALDQARCGRNVEALSLLRVLALEHWLQHLEERSLLRFPVPPSSSVRLLDLKMHVNEDVKP